MKPNEDLSAAIADLRLVLDRRVDSFPNLRDFPLGGAGYAEAVEVHQAETARLWAEYERLVVLRRAERSKAAGQGA